MIEYFPDYGLKVVRLYNSIKMNDIIDEEKNLMIYHYTSPEGFAGIIENKTLRFTDRFCLNDYSEGTYVLDLCIDNIDTLIDEECEFRDCFLEQCKKAKEIKQLNDFYVYQCSFSINKDSLCLWNYYTKGDDIQGYNLCFNGEDLCKNISLNSTIKDGSLPAIWSGKVIYNEAEQLKKIQPIIDEFFRFSVKYNHQNCTNTINMLITKLMIAGCFMKNSCFNIEEEYRIVLDLYTDRNTKEFTAINQEKLSYTKTIMGNDFKVNYIDVTFKPIALKGIGLSPTLNLKEETVKILDKTSTDFSQINENQSIFESNIPVRF